MGAYNIYAPTEATVTHQRVQSVLYNFGSGPYFIRWTSPLVRSMGPVRKLYPTEIPPILHILLLIFLIGEATAKLKEDISELTLK